MSNTKDNIRSEREVIQQIREEQSRGIFRGRDEAPTCPDGRLLLQIVTDETSPEGSQIHEHLAECPLCRFTYHTFLAAVKDDPSLDPHEKMPEHFTTPLREWIIRRRKTDASTP